MKGSWIAVFVAGIATAVAGSAIAELLPQQFADVPQGTYFADAVGEWWRRGVIKGYDNGRFGPDDPVTRGQMAVILDRFESSAIDPLRQEIMQINRELERSTSVPFDPQDGVPIMDVPASLIPVSPVSPPDLPPIRQDQDLRPVDGNALCMQKKNDLHQLFEKYRSCQVDADCTLFVRSCGPYLTCGKAVTKNVLPTLERSVALFEDVCTGAFPVACAACAPMQQRCEEGQCVTVSEENPSEEKCTTYLREGEEETYCATCGNGMCESFERCTSSNCQNGTCMQDCGGLYCPSDCN
ncbi:S-layer homology domain-containing protein [Candidatus Peregrinibacteria bacterium]|nr:S-layer homology domain-containing protein [Candidatus Peregrinibacteria bacterium]